MTTAKLYQKLRAGDISKQKFLYEVRKDTNLPWVTNVTSYEDAIKILKNKGIISEGYTMAPMQKGSGPEQAGAAYDYNAELDNTEYEELEEEEEAEEAQPINEAHDLTTAQIIDRLNPYAFQQAVEYEAEKAKVMDLISYEKIREKVAKKMVKDPLAYRYTQLANAKQVEKDDKRLAMKPVQANNHVDKDNEMKKIKGHADEKKNTSTPKTENKKGKPKGVKEMKGSKKKPKGVKDVMKHETKETVLNEMISFFKKKDNLKENDGTVSGMAPQERTDFRAGQQCMTPDGPAVVIDRQGSIVNLELEDGTPVTYTLNRLDKAKEDHDQAQADKDKAERDQKWSNFNKQQSSGENPYAKPFGGMLAYEPEDIHSLLKKLKTLAEKLKTKKEAVDLIKGETPQGGEEVLDTVPAGQGRNAIQNLKKKIATKGGSVTSLTTTTLR